MKAQSIETNPGFLVTHNIKVSYTGRHQADSIQSELQSLPGVETAVADSDRNTLKVSYDGSQYNIDQLLEIVRKHGARAGRGWWNSIKLAFARQTDQNVRDNASHHATCCSGKTMECCKNESESLSCCK